MYHEFAFACQQFVWHYYYCLSYDSVGGGRLLIGIGARTRHALILIRNS